jgi:hypothetical protein
MVLRDLRARRAARAPPFSPDHASIFNSYYNSVGAPHPRARRGLLTRPDLAEVLRYRQHVDHAVRRALAQGLLSPELRARVQVGLQHEQQHQELILTDVQHLLFQSPLRPAFRRPTDDMSFRDISSPGARRLAHPSRRRRPGRPPRRRASASTTSCRATASCSRPSRSPRAR